MTPTYRGLARLTAVAMTVATAGLAAHAQSPPAATDAIEVARADDFAVSAGDISGAWQGVFQLDSAWGLPSRASSRTASARMQFAPVGDATPATSSTRSVHPGTFDIDFSRFGFTLASQEALGWSVGADAMRARLNPTVDHGVVEVNGTFRGNAIVGTWRYASDPGGASGTFEMRRSPAR